MRIKELKNLLKEAIKASFKDTEIEIDLNLAPENFGEFSTTVPLKLAKKLKIPPIDVAQIIKKNLPENIFSDVNIAKPGYLNFSIKKDIYKETLSEIEVKGEGFLKEEKNGKKVQVEFVSANPTGPLHIGNGRGGIIGDVLSNLLSLKGYEVQREYYVNDAGSKMELFAKSILFYYLKKCGVDSQFPSEGYKGTYIEEISEELYKKNGTSLLNLDESVQTKTIEKLGKEIMLEKIKQSLDKFGVKFDNFFFESSLYSEGKIENTLHIFQNTPYTYEKEGAIWFKSTLFGDDKDRVLLRSNGEPTYTLADAAYHMDKWLRGFVKVIDVWGADHFGHITPMKALIQGMGLPKDFLDVIIYQIVHLFENGKEVMMSKHTGSFITLDELINEVGKDAARFFFLQKSPDTHLNFDMNLAKEQSMNNPVYYIQYTYARLNNILKEAFDRNITYSIDKSNFELLDKQEEVDILRHIIFIEEEIEFAVRDYAVYRIPFVALEFSQKINSFYQKYKVLGSKELEMPRLSLVKSSLIVLGLLFDLMGIEKKEKM